MPKQVVKELSNIEIDEISLVDRPANQHAKVAIAKRATKEDAVPEFFNENGQPVDLDSLVFGDVVFDEDGNPFQLIEDDGEEAEAEEDELALVGKAFGGSMVDRVRQDLSKALTDIERDDVISKAADEISKANARADEATMIAKSERDLRLTREYISKAADYNVAVHPTELGPVLMRMAETMSYDDCAVIAKALESASDDAFNEVGYAGGGSNNDVFMAAQAVADQIVGKSADGVSKAATIAQVFEENPNAYDEYLSSRGR
jgi:hypothetical protein